MRASMQRLGPLDRYGCSARTRLAGGDRTSSLCSKHDFSLDAVKRCAMSLTQNFRLSTSDLATSSVASLVVLHKTSIMLSHYFRHFRTLSPPKLSCNLQFVFDLRVVEHYAVVAITIH